MTPRFIVRPAAEADIAEAALWYESRSLGLGGEFVRAVDVCLAEIRRSPESFPQIYKTTRRAPLRRFPYAVYFVSSAIAIRVLAVCTSRGTRGGGSDGSTANSGMQPAVRCASCG